MADMKIAVRFRWKSCVYGIIYASAKSLSIIFSIKFLEMVSFSISFPPEMFLIIYHIIKSEFKSFYEKTSENLKASGD